MTELIEQNKRSIADVCRKHGVARMELFGSALESEFDSDASDVDLLVEFQEMAPYDRVDAYFGLLEDLRALLGTDVDLVISGAVRNPFIARDIQQTKQLLYAA